MRRIQLSLTAVRVPVARRPATKPDRINRIITTSATTDAVIKLVARRTIKLRRLYRIGIIEEADSITGADDDPRGAIEALIVRIRRICTLGAPRFKMFLRTFERHRQ